MRLLADESCDFSVVRGLRIADHDVLSITETLAGATDERVMALAVSEHRLLLTEDKEFGQLVYAAARENSGIVLIRYPSTTRATLVHAVLQLLATQGDSRYNSFVVMEPGRVRLGGTFEPGGKVSSNIPTLALCEPSMRYRMRS